MVRRAIESAGAALLGITMFVRISDGSMRAMVQGWYMPLLIVSAAVLIGAAVIAALPALRTPGHWHAAIRPRTTIPLALFAAPVIVGLAVSPSPLGSNSLGDQQTVAGDAFLASAVAASDSPEERNILQWSYAFETEPISTLIGQPVDIIGFVHRPDDAADDGFSVARFVVACCVADATGYTIPIQWAQATALDEDQWVHITGTVATDSSGGPMVRATAVENIDAPQNPYIYP